MEEGRGRGWSLEGLEGPGTVRFQAQFTAGGRTGLDPPRWAPGSHLRDCDPRALV